MSTNGSFHGRVVHSQDSFNGEGKLPPLPCDICRARCCLYFALEIDKPTTKRDFENLKWYVIHRNTFVFVEDGRWFLQINQPCRYLGKNFECTIYERRPLICREHGYDEFERPNCEYFHDEQDAPMHSAEYHTLEDIEALIAKRFPATRNGKKSAARKPARVIAPQPAKRSGRRRSNGAPNGETAAS